MAESRAPAKLLPNEVLEKSRKAAEELRQYLMHRAARAVSEIRVIQERLLQLRDVAYAAASDPGYGTQPAPIGESLMVLTQKATEAAEEILQSFEEAQDSLTSYNDGLGIALRLWEEMLARIRSEEATEVSNSTQSDNSSATAETNLVVRPTSCDEATDSRLFSKQIREDVSRSNDLLLSAFGEVTGWWHRFADEIDVRAKNAMNMLAKARQLGDFMLSRENVHTVSRLVSIPGVVEPRLQLVRDLTDAVSWAESSVKQSCIDQFNEREEVSSYAIEAVVALTKAVGGRLPGQDDAGQVMMDDSTP